MILESNSRYTTEAPQKGYLCNIHGAWNAR